MEENAQDELRLCPTCRMPISVLATRCRYCGETVGRPRKEEERFTIKDLGGEQKTTYTLPGNVREALEAYRAEMFADQPPEPDPAAPHLPPQKTISKTGIPEIDDSHMNLAALLDIPSGPPKGMPKAKARKDELKRQAAMGLGALVLLLAVLFGGRYLWNEYADYQERQRRAGEFVYLNRAMDLLAEGRHLDALDESLEALRHNDTPANRAIAADVRRALAAHVEELLNAERWSQAGLREASGLVSRALDRDKSPDLQALMRRVDDEIADYKLVLRAIDAAGGKATFIVHSTTVPEREQVVEEGDYVGDRFLVKRILPNLVRLEDTRVSIPGGNRQVVCRVMTQAAPD